MRKLITLLALCVLLVGLSPAQDVIVLRKRTVAAGSTLNNNLVSFWKLDEASGTRNDSVGTNHLTDNNTVTQAAGKVGNAAEFTAANFESLSVADNAGLSFTSSLHIVCWVYFDGVPPGGNYPGLVAKWDEAGNGRSYALYFNGDSSLFTFAVSSDGTAQTNANATTFGAPSTTTWYMISAYFDDTANEIGISVNNGTVNTAAFTGSILDSGFPLYIGGLGLAQLDRSFNGRLDACGISSRKLTATEVGCLYDSGNGQEPPFATCP